MASKISICPRIEFDLILVQTWTWVTKIGIANMLWIIYEQIWS